ncbi:MAG: IS200/IS605 family transposase [Desulfurella sp.]|uniref:IS200/IS605 family transposase n=1 Tax=Desulfurella sp. TaxID=1962857 RepID=UPI003D1475C5
MNLSSNRHAVFKLTYHLVVVTKYRHKVINGKINERLKTITKDIFENKWHCKLIAVETETDHIHIAFEGYPHLQLSKLVNNFKTVSSRLIRKEFSDYLKQFYWKPFFWSPSYCILSTGGAPIDIIRQYIENQKKPI